MDKEIIMEVPELPIEVIVTCQLRERLIMVAKLILEKWSNLSKIFLLIKKPDNSLRKSYIFIQLVIQCYTICYILDVYCLHIFNGSSTSETTIFVSY